MSLANRVDDLRLWATSRIAKCRDEETKFGTAWKHRDRHHLGPPQTLIEAWTERRSLQAVLRMLEEQ